MRITRYYSAMCMHRLSQRWVFYTLVLSFSWGANFRYFHGWLRSHENFPLRKLLTTSLRTRTALRGIAGRGEQDWQRKNRYRFHVPVHRQLLTNTSFLYATINMIPSHTRVDGKTFHGDDKPRRRRLLCSFSHNLKLVCVVIGGGCAAPLIRSGAPVMKIKTTEINFGASFRLFMKYNTPRNYPVYSIFNTDDHSLRTIIRFPAPHMFCTLCMSKSISSFH